MKICTACNTTYTDDTLNFCLVDGTTLTPEKNVSFEQLPFSYNPGSWSDGEVPTQVSRPPISYPNSEPPPTVASSYPSFPSTPKYTPQNFSTAAPRESSNRGLMYAAVVASTLIFGVVLGLGIARNWNSPGAGNSTVTKTGSNIAVVTNTATNSAPANSSYLSQTNQTKPTTSVKFDMVGKWSGKFNDTAATLNITSQKGETFSGTLSKAGYLVEVDGQINSARRTVSIKETKVLKTPAGSVWNLGINDGTFSESGKSMSGTGKDKNISYAWSFTRQ